MATKILKGGRKLSKVEIDVDDPDQNTDEAQLWDDKAKFVEQHIEEGDDILVFGELKTSEWVDKKTGEDRYRLVLDALGIVPCGIVPGLVHKQLSRLLSSEDRRGRVFHARSLMDEEERMVAGKSRSSAEHKPRRRLTE